MKMIYFLSIFNKNWLLFLLKNWSFKDIECYEKFFKFLFREEYESDMYEPWK